MTTTETRGAVWVRTSPSVDGSTYTAVLEVDDDIVTAVVATITADRALDAEETS